MPELPEVENAVRRLRKAATGRTIDSVELLHPALRRRITPARLRSLRGARVRAVERRGKHQLLMLDDGRVLHAHFRMTGDWLVDSVNDRVTALRPRRRSRSPTERAWCSTIRARSARMELHAANAPPDLGSGSRASRPIAHRSFAARRAGEEARTDQAGVARPARDRWTRQHLRGGITLACAHLAGNARVVVDAGTARRRCSRQFGA